MGHIERKPPLAYSRANIFVNYRIRTCLHIAVCSVIYTQIAARHRQNWHPLTPIHDPGGRKNSIWGLLFLSGGQYPRTSGGSCAAIRMACSAPPLQPQPSAANATQDVRLYTTALSRGLAIWSQKSGLLRQGISLRKCSDLKSMPRTVGSLRLRAVQLRRPLSPSRWHMCLIDPL